MNARIGIDVGGTFTDFVLADPAAGRLAHHKEPSTPLDPALAVHRGLPALLAEARVAPSDVAFIAHGTTLALNAILQRRGSLVALVVSRGNRDVMEIARLRIGNAYSFSAKPEQPLVPRELVFEIGARLAADGSVLMQPDAAELDEVSARIAASGVQAVAVMLLNAYQAPQAEAAFAAELANRLHPLPVAASATIWPEIREYERALVTALNAYVAPLMRSYYGRLEAGFAEAGIAAPIAITASNGGTIDLRTARERPIDSILSGPASGVIAAIGAGRAAGLSDLVTLDMGGTSTDIALVEGEAPEIVGSTLLGEIPLMLPVVNVGAIGAGGGSIVRVDGQGVLKVGPRSAGADPGPACYGRGGTEATITDCYLVAGILDAEGFLGGRLRLDRAAAEAVLAPIGARLGVDGAVGAAEAALRVATSIMATEVRKMLARRGADPLDFTLVPFGGAGPTNAALLAEEAGIGRILVPLGPGTFCAFGAIVADLRRDFVRSVRLTLGDGGDGPAQLGREFQELAAEASAWIGPLAHMSTGTRFDVSADLRYPGQAFDLPVTLRGVDPRDSQSNALLNAFHKEHHRLYGFQETASPAQVTRLALTVLGTAPRMPTSAEAAGRAEPPHQRQAVLPGHGWQDMPVYRRSCIRAGDAIAGPALIDQADTTVLLTPGWRARCLDDGNLLATRDMP